MLENKNVYQKRLVSMPGYIAQSLIMVLGMAVLFGFFSGRFIGISDTLMTIKLVFLFLTAGVVITVVVIVRNYSRFIKPINEISNYADALYNKNLTYEIDMKKSGGQKPVCGQLKVAGNILSEAISNTKNLLEDSLMGMDTVNNQCDNLSKTNTEIVMAINCVAKEVEKNIATIFNAQNRIKGIDTGINEFMDDFEVTVKGLSKTVDLSKEGDRNVVILIQSLKCKEDLQNNEQLRR
ncbi:hypothetical protein [Geosporobacter ferrireducens]|uniref:hypothetical protein n=1 Tax=Geosporobacter ferrireducens TaxID=1424294 RepID=UPI00139EB43C|nr:hypothetical protein [Geosporobacter ferrireducens]MTI55847.1 hypothetical protein [Geosporobacter ferrireducens]